MPGPDPRLNRKEGKRMGPKTFVVGKDGKREIIRGGKPPKETPEQPRLYGKPDLPRPRDKRRPESEPRNLLIGGQAKLDKNKNNKLDAQDFKILRAEKAKGRGMGLQDEKVKPGKVVKAKRGMLSNRSLPAMKTRSLPTMTTAPGSMASKAEAMKKMKSAKGMKRKALQKALKAAKATRIGKIAGAVAAVGLGAKAYLDKKAKKKVEGKMGGGMMKRPMGYKQGMPVKGLSKGMSVKGDDLREIRKTESMIGASESSPRERTRGINKNPRRDFTLKKKMGGGMMMRPMGYKTGKMIMARGCKLGRKKATKIT
mgnify:CR=1 FL=1|jgi:hypothetical protein